MPTLDPRIDIYIDRAAPFAQPILMHLRQLVHDACPEVVETMKWSFPHFEYRGVLCSMASFKQHCAFGFWKSELLDDPDGVLTPTGESGMGHLGQIKSLADLPPDAVLRGFILQAMKLNEASIKKSGPAGRSSPKMLVIPDYFLEALQSNEHALRNFNAFSYSHKKEYVEWIVDAKTEATRQKRLATAIEWMAEGKDQNWRYKK
jgi:uncharacterized protein YdeI (YjbR/CyaY-like superfamily)